MDQGLELALKVAFDLPRSVWSYSEVEIGVVLQRGLESRSILYVQYNQPRVRLSVTLDAAEKWK